MLQSIEFLVHKFSNQGLSAHLDRCAALLIWPEPTNVSELRSMLGTLGFWRSFSAHYAYITEPSTRLTCKNVAWRWGEEQTSALQRLKAAVAAALLLRPPDVTRPFFVVTAASDNGCGASLEQEDAQGKRHPVTCFSPQLNSAERRYPVHERELLAIVLALRTWRHYLYGSEFKVICQTDQIRPVKEWRLTQESSVLRVRRRQKNPGHLLSCTFLTIAMLILGLISPANLNMLRYVGS
jgi:hypothetical protein